jgi:hypothetical protein
MIHKIDPSRPAPTAGKGRAVELSKPEKVPEPCRSCGRNDLPERFHTHGPSLDHNGKALFTQTLILFACYGLSAKIRSFSDCDERVDGRVARYFRHNVPKRVKIHQMTTQYTKCPHNICTK